MKFNPILSDVKERLLKKNKNWLAIIVGPTGSGKSYSGLRLASRIDPTFTIDRVAFSAEEFMSILNSGKLRKGSAIVFDEAGVAVNPREWYSFSNRAVNYIMQTFRRDNLAVIFTTPSFDYIDNQIKQLFHAYLETSKDGINYVKKYVSIKWLNLQLNPRFGKLYYKYPRVIQNGRLKTVTEIRIPHPDTVLAKAYEKKKKAFGDRLKEDMEIGLEKRHAKARARPRPFEDMVKVVTDSPHKYIKEWSGRKFVDLDGVMLDLKVGAPTAKKIRRAAEEIFKKKKFI